MTEKLNIRLVTGEQEFKSLRNIWDSLLSSSPDNNAYLTWEWFYTWWQHFGAGKQLNILVLEDKGRVLAIVPLMRLKYGPLDVLENISSLDADYSGIVLTDKAEECTIAMLSYLAEQIHQGMVIRFSRVWEGSLFLSHLRKAYDSVAPTFSLHEKLLTYCPYVNLPVVWDELFASLTTHMRTEMRRRLKLLHKEHQVEFKSSTSLETLEEGLATWCTLHEGRWHSRGLIGALSNSEMQKFNFDLARVFAEKGWFNLSFLLVNKRAVSAAYGFDYAGRYYYGLPGFDPDYAKYGIGQMHVMFLMEDAIKKGMKEFDFLIGNEVYNYRWQPVNRAKLQIVLTRKNALSPFYARFLDGVSLSREVRRHGLMQSLRLYVRNRDDMNITRGDTGSR